MAKGARSGVSGGAVRAVEGDAAARRVAELDSVDVAYLPKNVEPRIDEMEVDAGELQVSGVDVGLTTFQQTLNLPPMGKRAGAAGCPCRRTARRRCSSRRGSSGRGGRRRTRMATAMMYTVEIRGVGETEWKLLKDKVPEKYLAWDSTAFPDGEYRLRVTASDAPGNPPAEALMSRMEGSPFWIDNTPPKITGLGAARTGGKLQVKWHAADALNQLVKAEYSVDGSDWKVAAPVTRLSDALELDYELSWMRRRASTRWRCGSTDDYGNVGVEKIVVK